MNSLDQADVAEEEEMPEKPAGAGWESDDDFENEELGERQPEACSMEDGCTTCQ